MRRLAILGRECASLRNAELPHGRMAIEGVSFACGLVEKEPPPFDPERQRDAVLLRVLAFSLNFRDRALILRMATTPRQDGYYVVGSEFVAEVLAVGADVSDLAPGDRVIPDGCYPGEGPDVPPGLPTNHGSAEVQVLPRAKVLRIPDEMDVPTAAAFTIGAQTAAAMVRRLALAPGARVLLTAAHSNTALFALGALRGLGVEVDGAATHDTHAEALADLGLRRLIVADPAAGPLCTQAGYADILRAGGYDAVIDPFADLYLPQVGPLMRFGGRYISCGLENQSSQMTGLERPQDGSELMRVLLPMILKNLTLLGNCLGTTADLAEAVAAHAAGRFPVVIDSLYRDDPAGFLARTFTSRDRFGKVVFVY